MHQEFSMGQQIGTFQGLAEWCLFGIHPQQRTRNIQWNKPSVHTENKTVEIVDIL